jgi:hypothetical protein
MVFSWSSTDCTDSSTWAVSLFRDSFCRRLMISKYFCFECSANANKLASASASGLTAGGVALCENVCKCKMRKIRCLESINTVPGQTRCNTLLHARPEQGHSLLNGTSRLLLIGFSRQPLATILGEWGVPEQPGCVFSAAIHPPQTSAWRKHRLRR